MKKIMADKKFYLSVLAIIIPIMIQQGIQTSISIIDSIMVQDLGDFAYRGVSVVNQLVFVLQILLVGGLAGPGIYISQYFGAKQEDSLRQTFKIKVLFTFLICFFSIIILSQFGDTIIRSFLTNKDGYFEELSYLEAKKYFDMILWCIPLNGISILYSTSYREIGEVKIPMFIGILAIFVNVFFNYSLMFGNFGFPKMGVSGAALGTILARVIECTLLLFVAIKSKVVFNTEFFSTLKIKIELFKNVVFKTIPMIFNELLWAVGSSTFVYLYAKKGTDVLQAYNISNTTANLFFTVFSAMAVGISILVGKKLGENKLEEAKENAKKLQLLGFMISLVFGVILYLVAPLVLDLYGPSDEIRKLAISFMRVVSFMLIIYSFNASCFFILRAGGKALVNFCFDSVYMWTIAVPLAFILIYFTNWNIVTIYLVIQIPDLLKGLIGFCLVKSGFWAKNLTE